MFTFSRCETPSAYICSLTAGGEMQGVGGRLRRRIIRDAGVTVSEMIMKTLRPDASVEFHTYQFSRGGTR